MERRTIAIELDGTVYSVQYEINRIRDGWFDLRLWYRGRAMSERCPQYSFDPHQDVAAPHGPILLQRMLSEFL